MWPMKERCHISVRFTKKKCQWKFLLSRPILDASVMFILINFKKQFTPVKKKSVFIERNGADIFTYDCLMPSKR